jgi:hypothetical protein
MKKIGLLSKGLKVLSNLMGIIILSTVVYTLTLLLLHELFPALAIPFTVDAGNFTVFYPFTDKPFLLGDYKLSFIVSYFSTMLFYALFMFLLARVFNAFMQSKLFTTKNVSVLSAFYLLNFYFPLLLLILVLFFNTALLDAVRITLLHLVIAVFAFYMAAIFKQGLVLQEEQDLTL